MNLFLRRLYTFFTFISLLVSVPSVGWTMQEEGCAYAAVPKSSSPKIEEIDDLAESYESKGEGAKGPIARPDRGEGVHILGAQDHRMPFQLGYEFQETKGLCQWALAKNTVQRKPFFFVEDKKTKKRLWHLVIDTSDIEFVTKPFSYSEEKDLERCIDSILLSFNVLEQILLEHRSVSFNNWTKGLMLSLGDNGFSLIFLPEYGLIENDLLSCPLNWVPTFTPQATIQHPLECTIPLSFMIFGFNNPRYMFSFCGSLPYLDTLRAAHQDADSEQFFTIVQGYYQKKLSGLVFLHAHTLVGMAGKGDSDAKLLEETFNHLQDTYQIDPKLKITLMSRRPFSDMFENLKLKINYSKAFGNAMGGNSSFIEDMQSFPRANYAEQYFHPESGVMMSLLHFLPLFNQEFAESNAAHLKELLSRGVISTAMLRNFKADVMTDDNQPVAQLSMLYCRAVINSVDKPEKRYNITLEKPGVQSQVSEYDALSPPWFLDPENSMGALKQNFLPEFGEAVVEFRGIRDVQPSFLKRVGLCPDFTGKFLTNPKEGLKEQALSLFKFLSDFGKPKDFQDFSLGLTLAVAKY